MPALDINEVWQIEVAGTVYEASFEELPSWISEGSLQPTDKVRKGSLRWIEASKVPTIAPLFVAKATGSPITEDADLPVSPTQRDLDLSDMSNLETEIFMPPVSNRTGSA